MQAVQAAQITFEDFFLSTMDISALKIVGFEGLWGSLAMFLVMLPVVQVHNAYACVACGQPFAFFFSSLMSSLNSQFGMATDSVHTSLRCSTSQAPRAAASMRTASTPGT